MRVEGKVIVVTGGTKKYGYHFCEGLAEAGGTVLLTSREQERADDVAAVIIGRIISQSTGKIIIRNKPPD